MRGRLKISISNRIYTPDFTRLIALGIEKTSLRLLTAYKHSAISRQPSAVKLGGSGILTYCYRRLKILDENHRIFSTLLTVVLPAI